MKLTEAEWQIMKALWQNFPATTRQIAERLPDEINWAYTTIKTMLTRLADKKAVKETKKRNVGFYEPVLTRQNADRTARARATQGNVGIRNQGLVIARGGNCQRFQRGLNITDSECNGACGRVFRCRLITNSADGRCVVIIGHRHRIITGKQVGLL